MLDDKRAYIIEYQKKKIVICFAKGNWLQINTRSSLIDSFGDYIGKRVREVKERDRIAMIIHQEEVIQKERDKENTLHYEKVRQKLKDENKREV
jgi:hypothetical protein